MDHLITCPSCSRRRLIVVLTTVRLYYCARCAAMACRPQDRELAAAELQAIALDHRGQIVERWIEELNAACMEYRAAA